MSKARQAAEERAFIDRAKQFVDGLLAPKKLGRQEREDIGIDIVVRLVNEHRNNPEWEHKARRLVDNKVKAVQRTKARRDEKDSAIGGEVASAQTTAVRGQFDENETIALIDARKRGATDEEQETIRQSFERSSLPATKGKKKRVRDRPPSGWHRAKSGILNRDDDVTKVTRGIVTTLEKFRGGLRASEIMERLASPRHPSGAEPYSGHAADVGDGYVSVDDDVWDMVDRLAYEIGEPFVDLAHVKRPTSPTKVSAAWVERVRRTYQAMIGHDVQTERWMQFERRLVHYVTFALRTPSSSGHRRADVILEKLTDRAKYGVDLVDVERLVTGSQLNQGGRSEKKTVDAAVRKLLDGKRRDRGLPSLPAST